MAAAVATGAAPATSATSAVAAAQDARQTTGDDFVVVHAAEAADAKDPPKLQPGAKEAPFAYALRFRGALALGCDCGEPVVPKPGGDGRALPCAHIASAAFGWETIVAVRCKYNHAYSFRVYALTSKAGIVDAVLDKALALAIENDWDPCPSTNKAVDSKAAGTAVKTTSVTAEGCRGMWTAVPRTSVWRERKGVVYSDLRSPYKTSTIKDLGLAVETGFRRSTETTGIVL